MRPSIKIKRTRLTSFSLLVGCQFLNSSNYGTPIRKITAECASHIRPDGNKKEDWQEIYWKNFYRDITTKTKAWEYEQEYRLILGREIRRQRVHGEEIRTRTYNFNSLKGIIFGIKTSDEDKLRMIHRHHIKENAGKTNGLISSFKRHTIRQRIALHIEQA